MNRRVVAATLALFALTAFLVWLLRVQLREEKTHHYAVMSRAAQKKALLPPPPIDAPQPVMPAQYLDVAQRTLFSKDRNPTVIVEVKPPPPKPPCPPLPSYYGQVSLGVPAIFLSTGGGVQKAYSAGDKIGDKDKFVIVGFDQDKITLSCNDEPMEKKLADLRPKEKPAAPHVQAAALPAQPQAASQSLSAAPLADSGQKKDEEIIGADFGSGFHGCVASDSSPDGTIKDGYRKVISHTMFGQTCHWETVK
jgi:hypothetical protein